MKSPHTFIDQSVVRLFCSEDCMDHAIRGRSGSPLLLGLGKLFVVGIGVASLSGWGSVAAPFRDQVAANVYQMPQRQAGPRSFDHLPLYGPAPPTEEDVALEYVTGLADHTWLHPLSGPERRMPVRATRAFGAPRPGDRPAECRSGHCGVDLGQVWGEQVFAVHNGVVLKVERRNKRNGGRYIRIAHSDGAVISHYFHLAAIPRRLRKGTEVRTGEVIGIVGDSGVETSGPHLHFAVSVRPDGDPKRQVYVDPEPLVALWPVKNGNGAELGVTPGVPKGATGHMKRRRHREARAQRPDQRGN